MHIKKMLLICLLSNSLFDVKTFGWGIRFTPEGGFELRDAFPIGGLVLGQLIGYEFGGELAHRFALSVCTPVIIQDHLGVINQGEIEAAISDNRELFKNIYFWLTLGCAAGGAYLGSRAGEKLLHFSTQGEREQAKKDLDIAHDKFFQSACRGMGLQYTEGQVRPMTKEEKEQGKQRAIEDSSGTFQTLAHVDKENGQVSYNRDVWEDFFDKRRGYKRDFNEAKKMQQFAMYHEAGHLASDKYKPHLTLILPQHMLQNASAEEEHAANLAAVSALCLNGKRDAVESIIKDRQGVSSDVPMRGGEAFRGTSYVDEGIGMRKMLERCFTDPHTGEPVFNMN